MARSFWSNEEMGDLVLDSIVCVVDSKNALMVSGRKKHDSLTNVQQLKGDHSAEVDAYARQIACADVLLLNKTDLVEDSVINTVEAAVRQINPSAPMHRTQHSEIPLADLFNIGAFSSHSLGLQFTPASHPNGIDNHHKPDHDDHVSNPLAHVHDAPLHASISTTTMHLPPLSQVRLDRLELFLQSVHWQSALPGDSKPAPDSQIEILRTKGYMPLTDGSAVVIQGVVDIFEFKPVAREGDTGKLVFIGRGVGEALNHALSDFLQLSTTL